MILHWKWLFHRPQHVSWLVVVAAGVPPREGSLSWGRLRWPDRSFPPRVWTVSDLVQNGFRAAPL